MRSEAIVRAAGTSFYRGMRVLPPDRRLAMYAIYAFCRMVDDIADEEVRVRRQGAAARCLAGRVDGLYRGRDGRPGDARAAAAVRASGCGTRTSSR